jgi:hypothetical protein
MKPFKRFDRVVWCFALPCAWFFGLYADFRDLLFLLAQDLKDFGREAGNVSFADIDRDTPGQGYITFIRRYSSC